MKFVFHPDAHREFQDATNWYEDRNYGLGDRFVAAIESAIRDILVMPTRFQPVGGGIRLFRLKKFPYKVYYAFDDDIQPIIIYAIMHERQKPDYWRGRVTDQSDG